VTVLRIAARVEAVSLFLLLVNLATVHWSAVAGLLGPLHGCAYLLVIGATLKASRRARARLLALVPGVGGLLAARAVARSPVARSADPRPAVAGSAVAGSAVARPAAARTAADSASAACPAAAQAPPTDAQPG
jgi:hypothetical protein